MTTRLGINLAEHNGMWRGDNVGYTQLHVWVKRRLPKPELCESCNVKPSLDLANVTGIYNRALDNWKYLCRTCHMKSDGRIQNLKLWQSIDKSDRSCNECSGRTYRFSNHGYESWYSNPNGWLCAKCYAKYWFREWRTKNREKLKREAVSYRLRKRIFSTFRL